MNKNHTWGKDGFCIWCHNVHRTDGNARSTASGIFSCWSKKIMINIHEPFVSGDSEIDQWLFDQMVEAQIKNGDPCIDNQRYADVNNEEQMEAYENAKNHGCCGSVDNVITHNSGRKFWIGFNYRH